MLQACDCLYTLIVFLVLQISPLVRLAQLENANCSFTLLSLHTSTLVAHFATRHFKTSNSPTIAVVNSDSCKLYCNAVGTSAYYLLKHKVIDGTPCTPDSNDICVNGKCMVNIFISNMFIE